MRYFCRLSYDGTKFYGWQHQPDRPNVQDAIEKALYTFYRVKIPVTGCGRTDTGVHARDYYLHFDLNQDYLPDELKGLNALLPKSIVLHEIFQVANDAHSRYNAFSRSYVYYIEGTKNPFTLPYSFQYYQLHTLDFELMQKAAALLLNYDDFSSFCKTHSGVDQKTCKITEAFWVFDDIHKKAEFHITANRFLRGMVRLVVGMCLNVGAGKLSLKQVNEHLTKKEPMPTQWSVVANGLFLEKVLYPPEIFSFKKKQLHE
jgi:tRNA pseudouridine38-40 synthase